MKKRTLIILPLLVLLLCCCVAIIVVTYVLYTNNNASDVLDEFSSPKYRIQFGEETIMESEVVGYTGNYLNIDEDLAGKNNAISMEIPFGALNDDEQIDISFKKILGVEKTNDDVDVYGDILSLAKTNDEFFETPIAITWQFDPAYVGNGAIGVFEYDSATDTISETMVIGLDKINGSITFLTTHFSDYIRITATEDKLARAANNGVGTGFKPNIDGWRIGNWGSFLSYGNCLGMTSIAKYYFENEKVNKGTGLYNHPKLIEGLSDYDFDDVRAQQFAGKLQALFKLRWDSIDDQIYYLGVDNAILHKEYGKLLMLNLISTHKPQLILTRVQSNINDINAVPSYIAGAKHSLLVFGYKQGQFYVYDPNFPYKADLSSEYNVRKIPYSYSTGFGVYPSQTNAESSKYLFNTFIPMGMNHHTDIKQMSFLLNEAILGYHDTSYPVISVLSVNNNNDATQTTIYGSIKGGSYSYATEKYMYAYYQDGVNLSFAETSVLNDGNFVITVPVKHGVNKIHLVGAGSRPNIAWAGYFLLEINVQQTQNYTEKPTNTPTPTPKKQPSGGQEPECGVDTICVNDD